MYARGTAMSDMPDITVRDIAPGTEFGIWKRGVLCMWADCGLPAVGVDITLDDYVIYADPRCLEHSGDECANVTLIRFNDERLMYSKEDI